MRSGDVGIIYGKLRLAGFTGYARSMSTSDKDANNFVAPSAYYFGFQIAEASSSHGPTARWFGFPLR